MLGHEVCVWAVFCCRKIMDPVFFSVGSHMASLFGIWVYHEALQAIVSPSVTEGGTRWVLDIWIMNYGWSLPSVFSETLYSLLSSCHALCTSCLWSWLRVLWKISTAPIHLFAVNLHLNQRRQRDTGQTGPRPFDPWSCALSSKLVRETVWIMFVSERVMFLMYTAICMRCTYHFSSNKSLWTPVLTPFDTVLY